MEIKKEFIIYGLEKLNIISAEITRDISNTPLAFDIKLILSEAVANAFIHGNKGDAYKPIFIKYLNTGKCILIEIQDTGKGFKNVVIPEFIEDEHILDERGRGLFLIKSLADGVEFDDNKIIIQKSI